MREPSITSDKRSDIKSGLLLAIGGTALFGLKSIFIKLAYAQGVDTISLLTMRMVIAMPFYAIMLLWLLRQTNAVYPRQQDWLAILGLGIIGYYLSSFLDMTGLNHISAQLERLTLYTYPIMTTVLGWLIFKETITRRILLALGLTYSGVVLLYTLESSITPATNTRLGVALVLLAAVSFSCYMVFSRSYIHRLGSRLFTSMAMLASTIAVFVHYLFAHEVGELLTHRAAWKYGFLLAIVSTLIPSYMISEAIARLGPGRTSIVGTIGPVFTIVVAVIVLDEPFGWYYMAGVVLVLTGVGILHKT